MTSRRPATRSSPPVYAPTGGRYRSPPLTGEFQVLDRLRRRFPAIGDDAALVAPPPLRLLLAADSVVAGVHADLSLVSLADLGWKAVSANVSDLAAMGGRPLHLLVSVAAPGDTDLDRLFDGIEEAAAEYSCEVVGGDLANSEVLVASLAVTGTIDGEPVWRSGARPGDSVFVTGPFGLAAAGLELLREGRGDEPDAAAAVAAHRRPRARLAHGRAARLAEASAMIDVSDGLAADLGHLARASGVGVALDAVPVAAGATPDQALHGGEDYELVFTAYDPERVEEMFSASRLPAPIRIGVCTDDPSQLPASRGWEHTFG